VTFTAIVQGAYPGEAKMCLRLIAETDARAVGDSHPSCYYFALTLLVGHRVLNADTMSIKQKMNKPLSFPVVLALTL